MDKMKLAHEMALAMAADGNVPNENIVAIVWQYADAMQAEADKRNKAEAAQKRKKIREMLNALNTFVEREGQHFDDVEEWQPDWSQAPSNATNWTMRKDGKCFWWKGKPLFDGSCFYDAVGICHTVGEAPSFDYKGDWRESLRERPQ